MTATTTPTHHWAALEAALRARRPVWITYHGRPRLICPYALGWHHGHALLLAYQTGGTTSTGQPDPDHRWRCLRLDRIEAIDPADHDRTWVRATSYNPTAPFPHRATTVSIAI